MATGFQQGSSLGRKAGSGIDPKELLKALSSMTQSPGFGAGQNVAGAVPGPVGGAAEGGMKIVKDVTKTLGQLYSQQALQAAQSGVPASQILSTLNQMVGMPQAQAAEQPGQQPQQPAQNAPGQAGPAMRPPDPGTPPNVLAEAAVGQQVSQPPTPVAPTTPQYQAPQVQPAKGMFSGAKLLPGGGVQQGGFFNMGPSATDLLNQQGQAIANVQGMQKIEGVEPFQKGEREKQELVGSQQRGIAEIERSSKMAVKDQERFDAFFKSVDEPASAESAKAMTFASEITDSTSDLLTLLEKDQNALKAMNTPGNPFGQKLRVRVSQLEQALLRYSSGATITKEEKKEIRTIIPKIGLKAWTQDPSTAQYELRNLFKRFSKTKELLDPNSKMKGEINSLEKAGFTRQDIWEYLRSKGRV